MYPNTLRATFDEIQGPGSIEIEQTLLNESHKLDPWSLDEGPCPKSDKSRLNLHDTILEGKSIGLDPKKKKKLKWKAHDLKNQDAS